MRKRFWAVIAAVALFACQLTQPPAPDPISSPNLQPTAPAESFLQLPGEPLLGSAAPLPTVDSATRFGRWEPLPVIEPELAESIDFDINALVDQSALSVLSDAERLFLAENQFVRLGNRTETLGESWQEIAQLSAAVLITSDVILLHTVGTHQAVVEKARRDRLSNLLIRFTNEMIKASADQLERLSATGHAELQSDQLLAIEAARRNLAYFSVAGRFFLPSLAISPEVADLVNSELALIDEGGEFNSPLLGQTISYSFFEQADTSTERVMLWYQLVPISVDVSNPASARLSAAQIKQLVDIWSTEGAGNAWRELYLALAYLDGGDADHVAQWQALFGTELPLDELILSANQAALVTFDVLPPPGRTRTVIDDALTYNQVGQFNGASASDVPASAQETPVGLVRAFSHPLDIAAALGSARAGAALGQLNEDRYEGYELQLQSLIQRYAGFTGRIPSSLEDGYLLAMVGLANDVPPLAPGFMRSEPWADQQLDLWQSAFWLAESAPSETVSTQPLFEGNQPIVVLPYPHLYATLATQTRQLMTGLNEAGLLSADSLDLLLMLESDLIFLSQIAVKNWFGFSADQAEQARLDRFLSQLDWEPVDQLGRFSAFGDESLQKVYRRRGVDLLIIAIEIDDQLRLAVGPSFKYEPS
ncbi:MAG: DUF3160 domain-containing protein [Chloroflexota bacterium]